jgi:nucleotide-binding universal stress UspA family protein
MRSVLRGGNETRVDQRGTIELLADRHEPAMLLLEMAGVGRERRIARGASSPQQIAVADHGVIMQFKRVVLGIDFSETSLAASRWIAHYLAPDAELVLVHAVPPSDVLSSTRRSMPRTLAEIRLARPQLHGGLLGLGELLGHGRTSTETLSGDPAEVLAFVAEQVGADLIGVGSGPRRGGSARFGATTPNRLIARTDVPVLVAPHVSPGAPGRILVPVDDRASGRAVLRTAVRLATAYEAALDVLYVIETDLRRPVAHTAAENNTISLVHAQVRAAAMVDDLDFPPDRAGSCVRPGDAGEETVSCARRSEAGLIVMGTGERGIAVPGDKHARHVGSTTRFVIWAAPCPVLVIPPRAMVTTERVRPARGFGSAVALQERDELLAEV